MQISTSPSQPESSEIAELYPRLVAFARAKFPKHEPEEAVHHVIARFLTAPWPYADSEHLFVQLCGATYRRGIDIVRESSRFAARHEEVDPQFYPDDRSGIAARTWETETDFENALDGLNKLELQIVQLRLDDHSWTEIARLLGRSKRGIRSICRRTESKLKDALS